MKTTVKQGKMYKVFPKVVTGADAKNYNVFSFYEENRNWAQTCRYAVDSLDVCMEVKVTKVVKGKADCIILNCQELRDYPMRTFAKKPYVRKDGTFTVVSPVIPRGLTLQATYLKGASCLVVDENVFEEIVE